MEAKHLTGSTMANKLLGLSLFLISVIACSGTSIKISDDPRRNALPTSKRFPPSLRQLLDKKVNSTSNETNHLGSSLIGETSSTTPTTTPIITTPTTPFTSPTVTPATPTTPTTTPASPTIPTTPVSPTTPIATPGVPATPTAPTTGSSGTWCVAKSGVSDTSLQVALDYACGLGGADCSAIQQGGACYNPDTVAAHASYAFDSYYKKSGMTSGSCDFGGNAAVTTQDPSTGTCTFTTGSSSSTVLNTSNPTGGLGSIPPANSSDSSTILLCLPILFTLISLALSIIVGDRH